VDGSRIGHRAARAKEGHDERAQRQERDPKRQPARGEDAIELEVMRGDVVDVERGANRAVVVASDFPPTYQVLNVNGCVSYNYYEKDYFPLKAGGTKNLDMVTNGLESWVNESGPAMGRFVGAFIDGKQSSYKGILKAA